MISSKHIGRIVAVFMALLVIFTLVYTYLPKALPVSTSSDTVSMEYTKTVFDTDSIMRVNIEMDPSQWEAMLDNATAENWYACDITINGTTYKNVGIRPKGNTSLTMIASDDTTDRFSFKIKFDYYIEGQTCDGLDCLVLNNLMSDATYMKEYFAYDMFRFMGVVSSLYSFADISLNGETWGLYLALEGTDASFLQRNYGTSYGELYKPETMDIGGGMGNAKAMNFDVKNFDKAGDKKEFRSHNSPFGNSSSNLGYTSDDISDYSYIFDNTLTDASSSDKARVIEALKNITNGTELETYLDIDQMLRYMAVNVFSVNLDSYFGTMLHNYLLYEENGQLTMLPWDYNLAFAGFQSNSASDAVNLAIDSVVSGASFEDRPILYQLMQVPEYLEKYHEYLNLLISEYFESGYFEAQLAKTDALITSYVAKDPTAFYTHEEYQTAVNTLRSFCTLRAESIRGQLDGTIPATSEAQAQDANSLIVADSINISDMGTQGGANIIGDRKEDFAPAGNFTPPDRNNRNDTNFKGDFPADGANMPNMPNMSDIANPPDGGENSFQMPNMKDFPDNQMPQQSNFMLYGICLVAAIAGLLFAKFYRRRK